MSTSELRDKLIFPIVVNLTTALIIFFAVVFFKGPIYTLLGPDAVERYPIYAVAEPYNDVVSGFLKADLFIINLTGSRQSADKLSTFLEISTAQDGNTPLPDIKIKIDDVCLWGEGKITSISKPQTGFNERKGKLVIQEPKTGEEAWVIRIKELSQKAIMKFVIETDISGLPVERTSMNVSCITVDYPGE